MSTPLYERTLAFDYGDDERSELMRKVWSVTPFMIDCFTGSINTDRERNIREWLHENIGDQALPLHGRAGEWQLGGATIHGWTWIGFAKQEQMDAFLREFPDALEGQP